eukprot:5948447-Alexandrium_andersonii.AAC.1
MCCAFLHPEARMESFSAHSNNLSGSLPATMVGRWHYGTRIDLHNNALSGVVPQAGSGQKG